jgi:hypothetical protein
VKDPFGDLIETPRTPVRGVFILSHRRVSGVAFNPVFSDSFFLPSFPEIRIGRSEEKNFVSSCEIKKSHKNLAQRSRNQFYTPCPKESSVSPGNSSVRHPRESGGPRGSPNDEKGKNLRRNGDQKHNAPVLGSRFCGNDGKRAEPAEKAIR